MKRSTEERSCPAEMDNNFQTHYKRLEKTRPPIEALRRFKTPAYEAVTRQQCKITRNMRYHPHN